MIVVRCLVLYSNFAKSRLSGGERGDGRAGGEGRERGGKGMGEGGNGKKEKGRGGRGRVSPPNEHPGYGRVTHNRFRFIEHCWG